ncbi:DUF6250 domain-containing protein [Acetobacter oeni]|nr:hypothetical protein [Acetobacter oeni]
MELLRVYALKLIEKGLLDEWHIWDFTRAASDRDYIRENYGPVAYIRPAAGYQKIATVARGKYFKLPFMIKSDFHLAIKAKGQSGFVEYVAGGWANGRSAIRRLDDGEFTTQERSPESEVFAMDTPGIMNSCLENNATINFTDKGEVSVSLDGFNFPDVDYFRKSGEIEIYVRGGFGHSLEMLNTPPGIKRFIGDIGLSAPYFQSFNYYADRYSTYRDDVFLKCDDDIVYLDTEHFSGYVDAIRNNPQYFLISANVVNNGICAYLQQKGGSLPESVGVFESPPGGLYGSLWESGYKASKLHEYFVEQRARIFNLEKEVVEWDARIFINFVGWRGENLRYMNIPQGDDEGMISVQIPKYLNKKIAVYSKFMVGHLSFFPQEYKEDPQKDDPGKIDPKKIIALYRTLLPV